LEEITVREDFLINTDQAAALCGVSRITIRQWVRRGHLSVVKREGGRLWFYLLHVARADQELRARGYRSEDTGVTWRLQGEPDIDVLALLRECDEQSRAAYQSPRAQVVYYLRFGDRIKIGTSGVLSGRMEAIPHDELLVTEPGGHDVETQRHEQFAEYRITGEWFAAVPPLLEHIARLTRR
jgi:excisionase family DNA binding protein